MLDVRDAAPGSRVRLVSGEVREIVDNPQDGLWLITRPVSPGGDGDPGPDETDDTFVGDVAEVLE